MLAARGRDPAGVPPRDGGAPSCIIEARDRARSEGASRLDEAGATSEGGLPGAFSLADRVAVISGASSAMGADIARTLADAGARLVLGDLATGPMDQIREALSAGGHEVVCQRTDVTRAGEVDALVALATERFGRIDVMANIAGVIHDALVVDTLEADLDRVLAINLKGVFLGCQAAARAMQARGSGSIVNMASSGGFTPIPKISTYSMSKAGVVALTRVLAAEAGRHGIRVNAIAPGFVEGGMTTRHVRGADGRVDEARMEASREKARRRTPLGTTGTGQDIANALLFLASDASRYVTGQVIHANGGAFMP